MQTITLKNTVKKNLHKSLHLCCFECIFLPPAFCGFCSFASSNVYHWGFETTLLWYKWGNVSLSWLSGTPGTVFYYWRLLGIEQEQYLANNTPLQYSERHTMTVAQMTTEVTTQVNNNGFFGKHQSSCRPSWGVIEWLCAVVERLVGDGGWRGTDNGLQWITRDEPPMRDGRGGGDENEGGEQQGKGSRQQKRKGWERKLNLAASSKYFPPVPCWMTNTQTARHHDGHSPPLMSPSHSWTHRCA